MEGKAKFKPDSDLRLMDQVQQVLRYHHYSYRTEKTYCDWILRYVKFHGGKTHPNNMGKKEVERFLSHLATHRKVSASTQRQALNANIFLYRHVLGQAIQGKIESVRARRHPRVPVVMTQGEVGKVLAEMTGLHLLMAKLLYGGGLRPMQRVRFQDRDSGKGAITFYSRPVSRCS